MPGWSCVVVVAVVTVTATAGRSRPGLITAGGALDALAALDAIGLVCGLLLLLNVSSRLVCGKACGWTTGTCQSEG